MALEIPAQKEKKTKVRVLFVGLTIAAVVTVIGITMALATSQLATPAKKCGQIAVKMFDDNNVPKYLVGPGYKITPVSPGTTDAMITVCS